MQTPLISVIVPVYNVEPYLKQCLDSIVSQTYTNIEIIIVNDGSTDNCPAICDSYANSYNRIKVIHKENGGLSSARNAGLEIATGEYIGYIDSDDYIAPDMYEKMALVLSSSPETGVVTCMYRQLKGEREIEETYKIQHTVTKHPEQMFDEGINPSYSVVVWNKLYRRSVIEGIRFYEGLNAEDNLYHYQVCIALEKMGLDMVFLPYKLYIHRTDNPTSICNNFKKPLFIDAISIFKIIQELADTPERKSVCRQKYYQYIAYTAILLVTRKEYIRYGVTRKHISKLRKEFESVSIIKLIQETKVSYKLACCILLLKYCPVLFRIVIPPAYMLNRFVKSL